MVGRDWRYGRVATPSLPKGQPSKNAACDFHRTALKLA